MDDEARQLAAATRAFEAARELHELHELVWEQSAELTAAIQEAAEAGVPRNSLARITGLSRTRVGDHRHGRPILVEPGSFSGELIAPPYPGRTPRASRPSPKNGCRENPRSSGTYRWRRWNESASCCDAYETASTRA